MAIAVVVLSIDKYCYDESIITFFIIIIKIITQKSDHAVCQRFSHWKATKGTVRVGIHRE